MGFKVDSSFLKFLTMGALASQRVMAIMAAAGLRPIELERYCTSNKIWVTKVKRLRLPDILCVATGLRVEVRAKSTLAIRMSDAPGNPDRRWSSSVKPDDMVAFVRCVENDNQIIPATNTELFWVKDLLASEKSTKLGPPKSASEGSERDREWKTIVPSRSGEVLSVDKERIKVRMDDGRLQTYQRKGLGSYVAKSQRFNGLAEFLAGSPRRKALFSEVIGRRWDPRGISDGDAVDRYVQAKALGEVGAASDVSLLKKLSGDEDSRVALEAAGSLAKVGSQEGIALLEKAFKSPAQPYLPMEAAFLLTELEKSPLRKDAEDLLNIIARDPDLHGQEVRQAAIWGLGRAGLGAYDRLLYFLDVDDENERIHAMVAFSPVLQDQTIQKLVGILSSQASARKKGAVVYVLGKLAPSEIAVRELTAVACLSDPTAANWAKAALGSLCDEAIKRFLKDDSLAKQLVPIQLLSPTTNWTKFENVQDSITFLTKQAALLR